MSDQGTQSSKPFVRPKNAARCPACGVYVVWQKKEDTIVPCEPQRRLVIFPEESANEQLFEGHGVLCLVEERTGRFVTGREATDDERKLFAKTGSPGAPFTIGREEHIPLCADAAAWEKGHVKPPSRIFDE